MKSSILVLLIAIFVLFGLSFTLSSCKKCSKDKPADRDGNVNNTPSDTTTSNATTDASTPLDDARVENGKKTVSHPLTEKQLVQVDLVETAKLAKKTYDAADMVGTDAASDEVHKNEASNAATAAENLARRTEGARKDATNQEIKNGAKAIELLAKFAILQVVKAAYYKGDMEEQMLVLARGRRMRNLLRC